MDQGLLKDLFEEENTHWWHIAKRKLIKDFLPSDHGKVLVLGVGGGRLCFELVRDFEVVAVDISPMVCEHAKNAYGIDTVVCDLEKGLPFISEKFDVIIMADVLEHLRDHDRILVEIRRCLVKGGVLLLTVPAYSHMWSYWDERLHHHRRYEFRVLKDLIESKNLKIQKITFFNFLIYPLGFVWRKLFENKANQNSDFKVSQGGRWVNGLVDFYYVIERWWIHIGQIPCGFSLFVSARKI